MKNVFNKRLPEMLPDIFSLFRSMAEQTALDFLRTVLVYLSATTKNLTMDDFRKAVGAAFPEKGDAVMGGFVEQLREEGKLEGLQQGMIEGIETGRRQATAALTVRQLQRKFRGLDKRTEDRIRQLPLEKLEMLSEDLIDFTERSQLLEWLDRMGAPEV
ncbi:MAG: DUF4351 domain-containing protein [Pseudomonadota bacterium]